MSRLIKIGKIVSPHGIKGQIKVYNYSRRDRFEDISEITIDKETFNIESITSVKNMVILKVHGIDDRKPAVKEFIKDVDLEKGITIETIPGLIDDEF